MIPYGRQCIEKDDIDSVIKVLTSNFLTQGPVVEKFEQDFAKYVDAKYAVAVNNATAGLHLSMLALGLKKGDRVITTPITFAASANCARFVGAEVWFADIDPNTYLIDIESVKELIQSKPFGFFKGIIAVDFAGLPVNLEKLKGIADDHELWIVEDACHAPGGFFTNNSGEIIKCGSGKYSECAVFSFHPVKHIACGEGGMVTTNSDELYKLLMLFRNHGINKYNMQENHGGWYYEMQCLGYNYRLTEIQASLGITQLNKNKEGVKRRNQIAQKYKQDFSDKIKYQSLPEGMLNAHHLFVIEVEYRKKLYDFLHSNEICAQIHYIPIHYLPYYKNIGYSGAKLVNAETYYNQCISLPMYPGLTDVEQDFVIEKVLEFVS